MATSVATMATLKAKQFSISHKDSLHRQCPRRRHHRRPLHLRPKFRCDSLTQLKGL